MTLASPARWFALALLTAATGILMAAGSATAADKDGFVTLFNGKDLQGWKTTGNWYVEGDGVLAIKPRPGESGWQRYDAYLWHSKEYGDFVLDLEFKLPPGGNSGVFFRVGDVKDPVETGFEIQILDSHGKADDKLTHHDNGGLIRTAAPTKNASKPAGEWNRMIVTAQGQHLKVELNGQQIMDVNLAQTAGKDKPARGAVGLQDHGLPLWFRNIRIKELK